MLQTVLSFRFLFGNFHDPFTFFRESDKNAHCLKVRIGPQWYPLKVVAFTLSFTLHLIPKQSLESTSVCLSNMYRHVNCVE